jgi:hypothetical protein
MPLVCSPLFVFMLAAFLGLDIIRQVSRLRTAHVVDQRDLVGAVVGAIAIAGNRMTR